VASHQAEAIVLRTWPIHEADLIVSLFTREEGVIKGVAKAAAKSRRRFGGALEPMTHVRANYVEKPKQELVRLDSFEILGSPLADPVDYTRAAVLAFFAEVIEDTLPEQDPQDAIFRLLLAVLEHTRVDRVWMPMTYFALWMPRLLGWLPDLTRCVVCETRLGQAPSWLPAFFHSAVDGLMCEEHRRPGSSELTRDSQALAARIFRSPVSVLAEEQWPRNRSVDLRRFALQALERHIEHRLTTLTALSRLGG
jgi:DNA repair protein RecO (recombination protein O)